MLRSNSIKIDLDSIMFALLASQLTKKLNLFKESLRSEVGYFVSSGECVIEEDYATLLRSPRILNDLDDLEKNVQNAKEFLLEQNQLFRQALYHLKDKEEFVVAKAKALELLKNKTVFSKEDEANFLMQIKVLYTEITKKFGPDYKPNPEVLENDIAGLYEDLNDDYDLSYTDTRMIVLPGVIAMQAENFLKESKEAILKDYPDLKKALDFFIKKTEVEEEKKEAAVSPSSPPTPPQPPSPKVSDMEEKKRSSSAEIIKNIPWINEPIKRVEEPVKRVVRVRKVPAIEISKQKVSTKSFLSKMNDLGGDMRYYLIKTKKMLGKAFK